MSKYAAGDVVRVYDGDNFFPTFTGTITKADDQMVPGKFTYKVNRTDEHYSIRDEAELRRAYTHVSPSALSLFENNIVEFYMKYVARYKAPGIAQTQAMSIGSSFDAYVKAYIIKALSRGAPVDPKYEFKTLFHAQVEEINRDWAWTAGSHAFDAYKLSGALADLMLEISQGEKDPQFEFEMKGLVKHEDSEIKVAGKPDLHFCNKHKASVIGDWKVNGFCSRSGHSPKAGYIMCRDGWDHTVAPKSRNHRTHHKDAQIQTIQGIQVNVGATLEMIDKDWATQLATYAWLMGHPVGSPFIAGIEQLACAPSPAPDRPLIRVASYRNYISKPFQFEVYKRYRKCLDALETGYFFTDVTRAESDAKCLELEKMAKTLQPTGDKNEDWMRNLDRVR